MNRHLLFFAVLLLGVALCGLGCLKRSAARPAPVAVEGLLDLRAYDFVADGPVPLQGQWEFHWNAFAKDIRTEDERRFLVPGAWNGFAVAGKAIGASGFGTYRLRVLLPPQTPPLAIKSGGYDSAARITVFGEALSIGHPGRTRAETTPVYRQEILDLTRPTESGEFVAEVSNFFHSKGGMLAPPVIGRATDLRAARTRTQLWQAMLAATFLIFGIYHLLLHLIRRNAASLYFGLFCVAFCLRTLQTGEEIIHVWLPNLDLRLDLALEYAGLFSLIPCAVLGVGALFPRELPVWLKRGFVYASALYAGTLLLPSEVYSRILVGYQVVILAAVLALVNAGVLAVIRKRDSARMFLVGFCAVGCGSVADVAINIATSISTPFASIGMVGFVFAQAAVIARRFSDALQTSQDLAGSLQIAYSEAVVLREQLANKEKMATIGDMAAGIVHDLKNPVAVIKGYAEMADQDVLGREKRQKYLGVIGQESDRLLDMVHDLLDFSRGSVSISKRTLDFGEFMDRLERALGPTFEHKDIPFSVECSVAGQVQLDPDRLLRAIMNIAGNAADVLSAEGQFALRVFEEAGSTGRAVVFELSDNGPGIPSEIQANLFEPFVTSGKSHGTGLGMAIARSLVEGHGGTISFVTDAGRGTTFSIRVPVG